MKTGRRGRRPLHALRYIGGKCRGRRPRRPAAEGGIWIERHAFKFQFDTQQCCSPAVRKSLQIAFF